MHYFAKLGHAQSEICSGGTMPRIQSVMAAVTLGLTRHRRRKARTAVHQGHVLSMSSKSGDRIQRELFNDVQDPNLHRLLLGHPWDSLGMLGQFQLLSN